MLPAVPPRPRARRPPVHAAGVAIVASIVVGVSGSVPVTAVAASAVAVVAAVVGVWSVVELVGAPARIRHGRRRFEEAIASVERTIRELHRLELAELHQRFPGSAAVARAGRDVTDATSGAGATRASGATPYLVLGRGAVESSLRTTTPPEPRVPVRRVGSADDPAALADIRRLVDEAATLADGPLCVEARGSVGIVGPIVLARAAAQGYLLQARRLGAASLEVRHGRTSADVGRVDVLVVIGADARAQVVRRDGRPCRVAVDLDLVSIRDPVDGWRGAGSC